MKNLGQLMKQAQEMQSKMAEMQESLGQMDIEGVAGAGLVKVTLTARARCGDCGSIRLLLIQTKWKF